MWLHQKPSFGVWKSLPGLSDWAWWTRCMATQLMAPPSLASVPQMVPRYSNHLGALYPRWVSRRWKVTPMPTDPESHHRNRRTPRPVQREVPRRRQGDRVDHPEVDDVDVVEALTVPGEGQGASSRAPVSRAARTRVSLASDPQGAMSQFCNNFRGPLSLRCEWPFRRTSPWRSATRCRRSPGRGAAGSRAGAEESRPRPAP